jgi:Holliday junction resolvase RusA-like endonuclease
MDLTIPIKAVSKERPRFHPQFKYAYTPKKTKDFESVIAAYGAVYMRDHGLSVSEGYIDLDLTIYNKVPASWSKKKTKDALDGLIRPTKGDLDNQLKSIMDGLNGVAYFDDKQVVQFRAVRLYDLSDTINIKLKEL